MNLLIFQNPYEFCPFFFKFVKKMLKNGGKFTNFGHDFETTFHITHENYRSDNSCFFFFKDGLVLYLKRKLKKLLWIVKNQEIHLK